MPLITPKTFIYAHRGACAYAPENTLEAFKLAAEQGADGIELDVRRSADGRLVVIHDSSIDRTANGSGKVADLTYEQLLTYDFGYSFYGECRGIQIPTLEQVYELLKTTDLVINVEIKSKQPFVTQECVEIAKRHDMLDRTIYSTFHHSKLMQIRSLEPSAFIAPLYNDLVLAWDYCANMSANAAHPNKVQLALIPELVTRFHEKGIRVHPFTANTEEEIQALLDADCDGIITNFPDRAIALRDGR